MINENFKIHISHTKVINVKYYNKYKSKKNFVNRQIFKIIFMTLNRTSAYRRNIDPLKEKLFSIIFLFDLNL